jgi:hypothetical protein
LAESAAAHSIAHNHRYPRRIFLAAPSIPQFTFRNINRLPRDRDRWFESTSLQQRVGCELDDTITAWRIVERGGPRAGRRCPAASARSRGRAFVEDVFEREDPQRERIVIGFDFTRMRNRTLPGHYMRLDLASANQSLVRAMLGPTDKISCRIGSGWWSITRPADAAHGDGATRIYPRSFDRRLTPRAL